MNKSFQALQLLHDLGTIYLQSSESKTRESIVIIDPQWLGKLFFTLVNHRIVKGYRDDNEFIYHPRLSSQLLTVEDFSRLASYLPELQDTVKEVHLSLLSILKKLEVCIEVRENEFLFPSMIENDKRNKIILDRNLHGMKTKSFRIKLSFMPVSFYSHLFVFLFQQCNDKFQLLNGWFNGAFFR
jgi:hypothetical protein